MMDMCTVSLGSSNSMYTGLCHLAGDGDLPKMLDIWLKSPYLVNHTHVRHESKHIHTCIIGNIPQYVLPRNVTMSTKRQALVALKRVVDYGSVVRVGKNLVRNMWYMSSS